MTKSDDELRHLILARRARFVAAAMGTSGVLVGCDMGPTVCLSPLANYSTEPTTDGGSPSVCLSPLTSYSTEPMTSGSFPSVCLEPAWTSGTSQDAGADAGDAASTEPDVYSSVGTSGGIVDVDAGPTSTADSSVNSSPVTSGSASESTSLTEAVTSVPTPCLSPPFLTDLDDSIDASTPEPNGSVPDASETQ